MSAAGIKQKRVAALLVAATLGLGIGLFLALGATRDVVVHSTGVGGSSSEDSPPAVGTLDQAQLPGPDVGIPSADFSGEEPVAAQVTGPDAEQEEAPAASLTLKFQTRTGEPVAGVGIVVSHHEYGRKPDESTRKERLTTSGEGRIRVSGVHLMWIGVRVESREWRIDARSPIPSRTSVDDAGWHFSGSGVFILDALQMLRVDVRYSDGMSYEGPLQVTSGPDPDENPFASGTDSYYVAAGSVEAMVPRGQVIDFQVESRRPGFSHAYLRFAADDILPGVVELEVQREESPRGVFEIDLSAYSPDDRLLVEVGPAMWPIENRYQVRVRGGAIHATPPRRPGEYRIAVRDDPGASHQEGELPRGIKPASLRMWELETITLPPSETVRVIAMPRTASAVRAKVVNESGEPLMPGRLFVETFIKLPTAWAFLESRFYHTRREDGQTVRRTWAPGFTDSDGVAVLPTVAPGRRTICVDAPACDIAFMEVDCRPGEIHDLGTIVLRPASGVIEVEVTNWDPSLNYTVTLAAWASMPIVHRLPMTGSTHRFERLSCRWYTISVENVEAKVGATSQNARLSDDETHAKLTFELLPAALRRARSD